MTLQLPLLARIEQQQQQAAAGKARGAAAQLQGPAGRVMTAVSNLPGPLPGTVSPWIEQQDLMAWLLAGRAKENSLQLNKAEVQQSWNTSVAGPSSPAASCSDLVVPQAPGSPTTPLHGFPGDVSPQLPGGGDVNRPVAASVPLAGNKRHLDDFQAAASVPRSHRRKTQHPHRAPLDSEDSPSPLPSSFIRVARLSPAAEGRRQRTPDRIHHLHHKPAAGKSRAGAAVGAGIASPAAGTVTKECHDCHTLKTPMWRRVDGNTYCNACGLRRTRAMVGR